MPMTFYCWRLKLANCYAPNRRSHKATMMSWAWRMTVSRETRGNMHFHFRTPLSTKQTSTHAYNIPYSSASLTKAPHTELLSVRHKSPHIQTDGRRRTQNAFIVLSMSQLSRTASLTEQETQLMLTTGSTRLAVSRGQQTWYHTTCYI